MNRDIYRKKLIWEKRKNNGILSIENALKILEEAVKKETEKTATFVHSCYIKTNAIAGKDMRGIK